MSRRTLRAVGALALTAIVVVGVPVLLAMVVGNPWPGRSRIEMRDDVAILVGLLAALAWLVWLRFMVALVVEIRAQVTELRAEDVAPTTAHVELAAPIRSSAGVGLLAQRLVAAILIVVPVATRSAPAIADGPTPLRARPAEAGLDIDAMEAAQPVASSLRRRRPRDPSSSPRATRSSAWPASTSVTATAGGRSSSSTATGHRSTAPVSSRRARSGSAGRSSCQLPPWPRRRPPRRTPPRRRSPSSSTTRCGTLPTTTSPGPASTTTTRRSPGTCRRSSMPTPPSSRTRT